MKLHLGCGKRYIEGFVHIDLCDLPHIDYKHRVDSLPMFHDGSVELIYSSHVFEYFDRQQAEKVLREWHRVLVPQGVLRLAVPDFQALIEVYHQTGELNNILGPLYGRMLLDSGADGQQMIYHRTAYDLPSLKRLLEANGFTNVRRYDWRQTIHKDYDDFSQAYFPHMDKEHGLLISLNVEAIKK